MADEDRFKSQAAVARHIGIHPVTVGEHLTKPFVQAALDQKVAERSDKTDALEQQLRSLERATAKIDLAGLIGALEGDPRQIPVYLAVLKEMREAQAHVDKRRAAGLMEGEATPATVAATRAKLIMLGRRYERRYGKLLRAQENDRS